MIKILMALDLFGRGYDIINFMRKLWPVLIVIFAGILASRTLLFQKGYFNMHDDLQMMRQLEMEKCFLDFQIPCRWVPDMGYGYGFPLFNFYPPLPYLVGEIFRLLGLSFVVTAKLLFAVSIIGSGVGMYYLAKEFFGRWGGILSALFYIWAPYHAVDVYVRGAMNESWGLMFFPFIFLYGYKLITEKKSLNKWALGLALSYFGLFTSHNLMIMIFTPVFLIWCLIWLNIKKVWNRIPRLIVAGVLSLGLSAFFTLPAVFENNLTWLKSQLVGYYDYTAHFVTLNQLLISRFWGYGPSVWMEYDGMPFPAGHIHWILSIVILVSTLIVFLRNKKTNHKLLIIIFYFFSMGWFSAFLTHVRATPIYQIFPFLALIQFPWRFLTLETFAFSFLAGSMVLFFHKISVKRYKLYVSILGLGVILFNWFYFLPQNGKMGKLTDEEKFSAAAWDLQQTAGIYDYLPATAKEAPKGPQKVLAEVMDADGNSAKFQDLLKNMEQNTNSLWFEYSGPGSRVRINILQFPNWKVYLDGNEINTFIPEEEKWGRIWINIPEGHHKVDAKFTNTPIRTFSNYISLFSWLVLIYLLVLQFKGGRSTGRRSKTKVS